MRIGIFTDAHYSSAEISCSERTNRQSLRKIAEAYDFFLEKKVELVVILGDLVDSEEKHEMEVANLRQIAKILRNSKLPTICVMGNHDAFAFEVEEFYSILGEETRPRDSEAQNFIFPDACYFANGRHYQPGDSDWTDTFLPNIEELSERLEKCHGAVTVFLHQNLDPNLPEKYRLANDAQVRAIFEKSGKVKRVFQGHYHEGNACEWNGIEYKTFPAMCEGEGRYDTVEIES